MNKQLFVRLKIKLKPSLEFPSRPADYDDSSDLTVIETDAHRSTGWPKDKEKHERENELSGTGTRRKIDLGVELGRTVFELAFLSRRNDSRGDGATVG